MSHHVISAGESSLHRRHQATVHSVPSLSRKVPADFWPIRLQATSIPTLLVAPRTIGPSNDTQDGDHDLYADYPQGLYSDGAYTALPGASSFQPPPSQTDEDLDPQEAYYTALLSRFHNFQSTFRTILPPPASSSTPQDISAINALLRYKRSTWRGKLLKTTPMPQWLAALPHEMVMFGLEMLGEVLTAGNLRHGKYGRNLGVWAWGLLGRCRDVGQLGSEEVGVLRELGKQASWEGRRVLVGEVGEVGEEIKDRVEEEEEKEGEVDEEQVEQGTIDQRGMGEEQLGHGAVYDAHEGVPQDHREDYQANGSTEVTQTEQAQGGAEQTHEGSHNKSSEIEASDSPLVNDTVRAPEADPNAEALGAAQERLLSSLDTIEDAKNDAEAVGLQMACSNKSSQVHMQTTPNETPREDILATLDMIITIVGEVYGQRDLLETRLLWDEINP